MTKTFRCIALTALTSAGVLALKTAAQAQCIEAAPTTDTAAVVVLLDESGSMLADGQCADGDVASKWICGVEDAANWVSLNDPLGDRVYFVWRFRSLSGAPELVVQDNGPTGDGFCSSNAVPALNALVAAGPASGAPLTPLAAAYCDAAEFLIDYKESINQPDLDLYIKLESDGLENNTPITHRCFGPDSATVATNDDPVVFAPPGSSAPDTVNNLQIGSWQALMLDVAITGDTHVYDPLDPLAYQPDFGSGPIITNVTFWETFIPPAGAGAPEASSNSLLIGAAGATPRTLQITEGVQSSPLPVEPGNAPVTVVTPSTAVASSTGTFSGENEFVSFLSALSSSTGGRFVRAGSGVATAPGDPTAIHAQTGDANDDGCVDGADSAFVSAVFGQAVTSAVPETFPADLNLDGVVDGKDLIVLNESFGEGCAEDPGEPPTLSGATLGFESLEDWTSTASLSLTGSPTTQGAFSLVVTGSGWREVRSTQLDTTTLSPSSILAYDLLLPETPVNPHWLGQTLLFVNAPSAGLYNEYIGAVELTGQPLGEFITVFFNLPAHVLAALNEEHGDLSFTIAINSSDPVHQLDNLRFVQ